MPPVIPHKAPPHFGWIKPAVRSRNWPALLRVSIAALLCFLCVLIHDIEIAAGNVAALSIVSVFIYPPFMPTVIYWAHAIMAMIWVCCAWAWCILGAKIGDSIRDHGADLRKVEAHFGIGQTPTSAPPPGVGGPQGAGNLEAMVVPLIFEGFLIQKNVSIFWGFWTFLALYALVMVRGYRMRLFFIYVFSAIIVLIFVTVSPMLPTFKLSVSLSWVFLVPFAYYLAVSFFMTLAIPTSISRAVLLQIVDTIPVAIKGISLQKTVLGSGGEKEVDTYGDLCDSYLAQVQNHNVYEAKRDGGDVFQRVEHNALKMDLTYSRFGADDTGKIDWLVARLGLRMAGFVQFVRHALMCCESQEGLTEKSGRTFSESTAVGQDAPVVDEKGQKIYSEKQTTLAKKPSTRSLDATAVNVAVPSDGTPLVPSVATVFSALRNATPSAAKLVEQTEVGLELVQGFVDRESSWFAVRWFKSVFGRSKPDSKVKRIERAGAMRATLMDIDSLVKTFDAESASALKELVPSTPTPSNLPPSENISVQADLTPSYLIAMYSSHLLEVANATGELLALCAELEAREKSRIHYPKINNWTDAMEGIWGTAEEGEDQGRGEEVDTEQTVEDIETNNALKKRTHPVKHIIIQFFRLATGRFSMFAIKTAIAGTALCVPAWIYANGSAKFYYKNKGQWTTIMAMTGGGMWAGESTYGWIMRVVGTVLGGSVALLFWTICAPGNGDGNPYGLAVLGGLLLFPCMMVYRCYSSNFIPAITTCTNIALIVGYSYADKTLNPYLNPGGGWSVAYRRCLGVLIGITAGWIAGFFPKPYRAHYHVRRVMANCFTTLGKVSAQTTELVRTSPPRIDLNEDEDYSPLHNGKVDRPHVSKELMNETEYNPADLKLITKELMYVQRKVRTLIMTLVLCMLEPDYTGENIPVPQLWKLWDRLNEVSELLNQILVAQASLHHGDRNAVLNSAAFSPVALAGVSNMMFTLSTCLMELRPFPNTILEEDTRLYQQEMAKSSWTVGSADDTNASLRSMILVEGSMFALWKALHDSAEDLKGVMKRDAWVYNSS